MKYLSTLTLFLFVLSWSACDDDDMPPPTCESCPELYVCDQGTCVKDPDIVVPDFQHSVSNPVMDFRGPGLWDGLGTGNHSVIFHDGQYKMWYVGKNQHWMTPGGQIGYATSTDGENWTRYSGNPVLSPDSSDLSLFSPVVLFDEGKFKMWVTIGFPQFAKLKYSESTDGINWSTPELLNFPEPFIQPGSVIKEGGEYRLYYSGNFPPQLDIRFATSIDGKSWTPHGSPILNRGELGAYDHDAAQTPAVVKDANGNYHMFYSADMNPGVSALDQTIAYATSTDGINWIKYPFNPVINIQPWINDEIYACAAVIRDNKIHLWYGAWIFLDVNNNESGLKIGYATRNIR